MQSYNRPLQSLYRHGIIELVSCIQTIYIPGDNDIGGEGYDMALAWKVKRYEKHFGNISDVVKFGFVDYAKVNTCI